MINKWLEKQKAKSSLLRVFRSGNIFIKYAYGKDTKGQIFPSIKDITITEEKIDFYFVIPIGMDPDLIEKNDYCFNQVFGSNIKIKNNNRKFYLTVYKVDVANERLLIKSPLRLGYKGSKSIYWNVTDIDTLMRPVMVISNPGEGKSEMLVNKFLDWINMGYGGAIMDVADGKVVDKIIHNIPDKYKEKVVLLDFNDIENPPGLSNFSESEGNSNLEVSQAITQMWTEFYVNYFKIDDHHRSKDFIRKSSVPIFSFKEYTILEQYLMIASEEFRETILERMSKDRRLLKYYLWWSQFNDKPIKVKNEETKAILNKFDLLMDNEILKNIVCQTNSKVPDFKTLMNERKIVLIKAGEGALHYEGSRILGALILMKFWTAALSRYKQDVKDRVPFKLFCDEPQNYIASGQYVEEMLAKSRKYRLGLEFYFQDPIQIEKKDKDLLRLMIGMNPHLILGKMSSKIYLKYFKDRINPIEYTEGDKLKPYHWIASIYHKKEMIEPFIMKAVDLIPDPSKEQEEKDKDWIYKSKIKYTRKQDDVMFDIQRREFIGVDLPDYDDDPVTIKGNATKL